MDGTNTLKETTRVTAPAASSTLNVNVFTAPGKAMVGERPKPFGEPLGFDPLHHTAVGANRCANPEVLTYDWIKIGGRSRRMHPLSEIKN